MSHLSWSVFRVWCQILFSEEILIYCLFINHCQILNYKGTKTTYFPFLISDDCSISQVINHGISQSVMDCALEAASDFFKLPSETKEKFASEDLRRPVRYDTSSKDSISMPRAFLKHYAHPLSEWIQYWPQQPSSGTWSACEYGIDDSINVKNIFICMHDNYLLCTSESVHVLLFYVQFEFHSLKGNGRSWMRTLHEVVNIIEAQYFPTLKVGS